MKGYLGLRSFPDGRRSRTAEPDVFPMGIPGTGKERSLSPTTGPAFSGTDILYTKSYTKPLGKSSKNLPLGLFRGATMKGGTCPTHGVPGVGNARLKFVPPRCKMKI